MDLELARHALSLFGAEPTRQRKPPAYRQPVFATCRARVVRPFRYLVGDLVRRVEPGEMLDMTEPDYVNERALGRVEPE